MNYPSTPLRVEQWVFSENFDKATTDIPVMFLSSKVGQAERIKGFSVGGADYIYN
ncbi:hypothetical protein [Pseudoalteromonas sp. SCSIO_11900]|uniref:hypothetical protein n=1 Tax=Pseudoalteromonas sp. SCSIO_11900 TaxID=1461766 RepID=UPI0004B1ECC1|nr:hypothetical protein [Pseudoalteromonas sp. SCSIO_11900]